MSFSLIPDVFATTVTQGVSNTHTILKSQSQNPALGSILMLVVFFVFVYFFIIRPQSKRLKEQRGLLNSLKQGDEVITNGGLVGKISKIEDNFVRLNIANNVEVVIQKPAVSALLPKGTVK